MTKPILFSLLLLLAGTAVQAQHTEPFELPMPTTKVSGALYSKLAVLDSRMDTTSLGFVQTGGLNRRALVKPMFPLNTQLINVFNALVDAPKQQGELLLQLRQIRFAEFTTAISEKGYLSFRATLYTVKDAQYQVVGAIDTLYIKSAMDVTKGLLKDSKEIINGFIAGNLLNEAKGPILTYNEVFKIDSVEKSKLPIYNAATFTDGLYLTYKSFKNQTPDSQFELSGDNLNQGTIKAPNSAGEIKKVKTEKVYAVVYKGQPYISSMYLFYPIKRENGELLFTGKGKIATTTGEAIVAGSMFGLMGSLAVSDGKDAMFDMKIDHVNGDFIRLREIKGTRSSVWDN